MRTKPAAVGGAGQSVAPGNSAPAPPSSLPYRPITVRVPRGAATHTPADDKPIPTRPGITFVPKENCAFIRPRGRKSGVDSTLAPRGGVRASCCEFTTLPARQELLRTLPEILMIYSLAIVTIVSSSCLWTVLSPVRPSLGLM